MPARVPSFDSPGVYWASASPAKRRAASPARLGSPARAARATSRPSSAASTVRAATKKEIEPFFLLLLTLAMGCASASLLLVIRSSPDFVALELRAAAALGICSIGVWLLSIPLIDVSIVDIWWPVAFLAQAFAVLDASALGLRQRVFLALLCIWALRLAGFLTYRKVLEGGKEDSRYTDYVLIRKRGIHPNWQVVLASLLNPFLQQALMQLLIGSPVVFLVSRPAQHPLGALDLAAALLWCTGFAFEAGSDLQLARFKSVAANRGKVPRPLPSMPEALAHLSRGPSSLDGSRRVSPRRSAFIRASHVPNGFWCRSWRAASSNLRVIQTTLATARFGSHTGSSRSRMIGLRGC